MEDNKTYFVLSDVHSFYTPMKKALWDAGYRKTNKNHILIVCGDIFDRGDETMEVYNFLRSIPKTRLVLVRGNHEYLYKALLNKSFPESYDFSNGTVRTFCAIADNVFTEDDIKYGSYYSQDDTGSDIWYQVRNVVKESQVTKWLNSKVWRDYYEVGNFIFVHSFIPVKLKQEAIDKFGINAYGFENPVYFEYDTNWRKSTGWEQASWGCPWEQYKAGLFKPEEDAGNTLVCGHWHTSDFYAHLDNNYEYDRCCGPIYYSKGLIGLDGGVMYSYRSGYIHPQNILVIKNEKCYDKDGNLLYNIKDKPKD